MIEQRFGRLGYGCTLATNGSACEHAQHGADTASGSDEYENAGNKRYKVVSGKSLRQGFEMSACNALSKNGLRTMFAGRLAAFPETRSRIIVDTGANRSFVRQDLVEKHDLKLTDSPMWMNMAEQSIVSRDLQAGI